MQALSAAPRRHPGVARSAAVELVRLEAAEVRSSNQPDHSAEAPRPVSDRRPRFQSRLPLSGAVRLSERRPPSGVRPVSVAPLRSAVRPPSAARPRCSEAEPPQVFGG